MVSIKNSSDKFSVSSVNAEIVDDSIVPGLFGKVVDFRKSYHEMKEYGAYSENLTVIVDEKPVISIDDNYDKYISRGNLAKRKVSFIFLNLDDDLERIVALLRKKQVVATFFMDGSFLEKNKNRILSLKGHDVGILSYQGEYDSVFLKTSISYLESLVGEKVKFCYSRGENSELLKFCAREKLHTIKGRVVEDDLYPTIRDELGRENIFVFEKYDFEKLSYTIDYVRKKGYEFVRVQELLSEELK